MNPDASTQDYRSTLNDETNASIHTNHIFHIRQGLAYFISCVILQRVNYVELIKSL